MRPKKPEELKLKERVQVQLNAEQRRRYEKAMKRDRCQSLSDFIRRSCDTRCDALGA